MLRSEKSPSPTQSQTFLGYLRPCLKKQINISGFRAGNGGGAAAPVGRRSLWVVGVTCHQVGVPSLWVLPFLSGFLGTRRLYLFL